MFAKILLLVLLVLPFFGIKGQQGDVSLKDSSRFQFKGISIDRLGKRLVYTADSVTFWKEKQTFVYDYSAFGKIEDVISINGLKYVLFDIDNQKVVFLDNTMTEQQKVLFPAELGWVQDLCWSENGNFWFYDEGRNEVIITDTEFNELLRTGNLELNFGWPKENQVDFYYWNKKIVVTNGDSHLVFDQNGTFIQKFKEKGAQFQGVSENVILGIDAQGVYLLDISLFKKEYLLNRSGLDSFAIFEKDLYLISQNKLYIYRIH